MIYHHTSNIWVCLKVGMPINGRFDRETKELMIKHQFFGGMYNSVSTKTRIQPNFGYKLVLGCEILVESQSLLVRSHRSIFAG